MADKYCDHGAYGAGSGTASTSGSSSTLTIASTSSGIFNVGSELTGTGIDAGTFITALGTYNGTSGTVTMSAAMTVAAATDITGKYAHPWIAITTAMWGIPQEGDGTATTAATASATVSIDLSAATAAAGATVSVMGAVLTCVTSGATVNQFNAGSGATLVANLVAAINRTTATSTITAQATRWATPKIQDAVFAKVGAPTTTLMIMTRAGSAQYNSSLVTTSGLTGGTFGPYTFSGGSGGCWGYLANLNGTIWPSAIATITNYGVLGNTIAPTAGTAIEGDVVHLRSNKIIYAYAHLQNRLGVQFYGTVTSECEFRVDATQAIWTSDPANSIIEIRRYATSYQNTPLAFSFAKGDGVFFNAPRTASGARSFVLKTGYGDSGGGMSVNGSSVYKVRVNGISLESSVSGAHDNLSLAQNTSDGFITFTDCYVKNANNNPPIAAWYSSGSTSFMTLVNCEFDATSASVANLGIVTLNNLLNFQLIGCKFTGYISGSKLTAASVTAPCTLELTSCQLGNIDLRGPVLGGFTYGAKNTYVIAVESSDPSRDFSVETRRGLTEWNSKRSFPYLNAKLHDGITPWSVRMLPSQSATSALRTAPFEGPSLSKINTLADGTRTATLELLIADTLTLTTADIELLCMYINTSNAQQVVSTLTVAGSALNSSTAAWSSTVFVDGGSVNFNKFKIEATLPNVKSGVVMAFLVRVFKNVSNTTQNIFIDPEISVV
jgi:hypothetical protein